MNLSNKIYFENNKFDKTVLISKLDDLNIQNSWIYM